MIRCAPRWIIKAAETQNPPRHLVPGAFGVEEVRGKIAGVIKEIDAWKETFCRRLPLG